MSWPATIAFLLLVGLLSGKALADPLPPSGFGSASTSASIHLVNIIDGQDDRDSLLTLGPALGLSPEEIARIRKVSGYVGCFLPSPSVGTAALFLSNRQILTAAHILFQRSGKPRSKCFFKNQDSEPVMIDLLEGEGNFVAGSERPKAGSNNDWAIARLAAPVAGGVPVPVDPFPVAVGDSLIVVTAHPAGLARELDKAVPVVQACSIRRVAVSTGDTNFYRSDCDATGSSSGGMHLSRVDGELVYRGVTITSGDWQDGRLRGAPYNERRGSVTTALSTDAAILEAGLAMAAGDL